MKLTLKTFQFLLLMLALSACQNVLPEPTAPPKTSLVKSTDLPTKTGPLPHTTEVSAIEFTPATKVPTLLVATEPITDAITSEPLPMPMLTKDHQDLTYGSGQMVVAFGEGFLPGEAVAISLIHTGQGVLLNKSADVDGLGYVMAVKRLTKNATDKDALPPGQYFYRLAGAARILEFRFRVDYFYQPKPSAKGCSYYPEKAVFEGYQVFWCAGLESDARYALTSQQDKQIDRVINISDPSGLVVFPLRQSSDTLTFGLWTVTLGKVLKDDQEPVDIGIPPLSVQILAPGSANP